jgi:hypothetical protein
MTTHIDDLTRAQELRQLIAAAPGPELIPALTAFFAALRRNEPTGRAIRVAFQSLDRNNIRWYKEQNHDNAYWHSRDGLRTVSILILASGHTASLKGSGSDPRRNRKRSAKVQGNQMEKTMYDINLIIKMAKDLNIKLTNAELDTEICQCWMDRVLQANMQFERGDMAACLDTIEDANRYAI